MSKMVLNEKKKSYLFAAKKPEVDNQRTYNKLLYDLYKVNISIYGICIHIWQDIFRVGYPCMVWLFLYMIRISIYGMAISLYDKNINLRSFKIYIHLYIVKSI